MSDPQREREVRELTDQELKKAREQRVFVLNPACPEPFLIQKAAQVIRDGGTVVFPTETVYGLGANGLDPRACEKIYKAKGRPSDNPLILHIAEPAHIEKLGRDLSDNVEKMAKAFWPGPLTMVVKKKDIIPKEATGGLDTVAVRCPVHPVAHQLIKASGLPVAAPSANLSGSPSPTKGEHVLSDLSGRVDLIITADASEIGVESTVVDMTGEVPVILRPGRITREDIEKAVGACRVSEAVTSMSEPAHPASPGMKYTHYSPGAEVVLLEAGDSLEKIERDRRAHPDAVYAVMGAESYQERFKGETFYSLGNDPKEFENRLFSSLRALDEDGITRAAVILPEDTDQTLASRDRLMHAAGYAYL